MDKRKELKLKYKQTWKRQGVYCFKNTKNGKVLIGPSQDLSRVENRIRFELRTKASYFTSLQEDWNAMGPDVFEFSVLEEVKEKPENPDFDYDFAVENILEKYLEEYQPYGDKGYNHYKKDPS